MCGHAFSTIVCYGLDVAWLVLYVVEAQLVAFLRVGAVLLRGYGLAVHHEVYALGVGVDVDVVFLSGRAVPMLAHAVV